MSTTPYSQHVYTKNKSIDDSLEWIIYEHQNDFLKKCAHMVDCIVETTVLTSFLDVVDFYVVFNEEGNSMSVCIHNLVGGSYLRIRQWTDSCTVNKDSSKTCGWIFFKKIAQKLSSY